MAYNNPYNPDELPRFAEPEPKGGDKPLPRLDSLPQKYQHPPSPQPQQQQFRQHSQHQQQHPQQHQQHQQQYQQQQQQPPRHNQYQNQPPRQQQPLSPRDHYDNTGYQGRPGPSLPSGPRNGQHMPPPRSPQPQHMSPSPTTASRPVIFQANDKMSPEDLLRLFRELDTNATGFITEKQLSQRLINGDPNASKFSRVTVNMMVRMFDSNRNGELEFKEFVGLWEFLEDWRVIFNKFDKDRSGSISLSEFKFALVSFKYRLSDSFMEFLFDVYDRDHRGTITFDVFMQACITLKRMTDVFKKYDDDRDGYIIINFEDFVSEVLRQMKSVMLGDDTH